MGWITNNLVGFGNFRKKYYIRKFWQNNSANLHDFLHEFFWTLSWNSDKITLALGMQMATFSRENENLINFENIHFEVVIQNEKWWNFEVRAVQKSVNIVDLVKRFQSLSMSLFLNLLFQLDSYSNEYSFQKSKSINLRTSLSKLSCGFVFFSLDSYLT